MGDNMNLGMMAGLIQAATVAQSFGVKRKISDNDKPVKVIKGKRTKQKAARKANVKRMRSGSGKIPNPTNGN